MKSNLAIPFLSFSLILSACNKMEFTPMEPQSLQDIDFPVDPQPTTTTTTTNTTTTVIVTTTTQPPVTTTTLPPTTTTTLPPTTTTTLPPTTTTTLPPTTTTLPPTTTTTTSTTTTTTLPPPVSMATDFTVTSSSSPSDILMIIDNSSSMFTPLREDIPYRFDEFMDALMGKNYHVAVTTGDAVGSKEYEAGRITRILRAAVPGPGIPLMPARRWLNGSEGNREPNLFLTTIMRPEAICVQVGTHLCPNHASSYQEPLRALSLFLDNPQGFLRPNSDLHVVIVAGRDEANGSSDPQIVNRPQQVLNKFNSMYPNRRLRIHTVARQPDMNCFGMNDYREANTLAQASRLTGGQRANICDSMERDSINQISRQVSPQVVFSREFDLSCDPIDMNNDGSPDVRVVDVRTGTNVGFTRSGRRITIPGTVSNNQEFRALYHCRP